MIIVVNGAPRAGKDTFCEMVQKIMEERVGPYSCRIISTVDFVKEVAKFCGWNGQKTPKDRKFLSDLKDILTQWDDIPYKDIIGSYEGCKEIWKQFGYDEEECLYFIMCREPKEIQKFVDRIGARTLIVERVEADEQVQSNHADANVHDYTYNTYIHNNRTLKDLEKIAYKFTDLFLKGEKYEGIYW